MTTRLQPLAGSFMSEPIPNTSMGFASTELEPAEKSAHKIMTVPKEEDTEESSRCPR
jgi:hypothetical protein